MKRLLWIFIMVLPLCISGCSDDETQQITCAIQVPSDGETIQVRADEKLFIRGYGKADHGQIVSAELKVAGSVIPMLLQCLSIMAIHCRKNRRKAS